MFAMATALGKSMPISYQNPRLSKEDENAGLF
jgi:hypothetical protein